jgi:beta-lactamase regulating signal transducer with metallopeptidase domain
MHFLTQSPLLNALGWALFNSLWQMALLWLSYSLLILIFNNIAARICHGLALLCLGIGTIWSAVTLITVWSSPETQATAAWIPLLSPSHGSPGWLWPTARSFISEALPYGSSLYLLALAGLLVRYSGHYRQSRKLTRQGLSKLPSEFRVFVAATSRQMGIGVPVSAWLSSLVDVPLTLGCLKPIILLPVAMISHLTPQQVEAILVHELAHIRRKDYLVHLVATILEGLFFFNPFSRLLIDQLKKEREHCCDDLVLQFRYDPHSYVSALLSLATRSRQTPRVAMAATGGGDKLLLQRAKRILRQKKSGDRPGARPLVLLFFTLLMTVLMVYRPSHPGRRQQEVVLPAGRPLPASAIEPAMATITSGVVFRQTKAMPRPSAAHQTTRWHRLHTPVADADPDEQQPEYGERTFISTADDGGEAEKPGRDYSLGRGQSTISAPTGTIEEDEAPFVPNSSFSFQYTLGDSSRPEEQLAYLQQSARREIMAALNQLQKELAAQEKALATLRAKAEESIRFRQQFNQQQLKLQQQYLKKISSWQKKLEKVSHFRIVYI